MYKLVIAFVFSCVFALPASANSGDMEKKRNECGELSGYRQIYYCYSNLYKESDALLNKEYSSLMAYLGIGSDKENLRDAQRKWIQFRDADCLFSEPREEELDKEYYLVSVNKSACLAIHTIKRLKELEQYNDDRGCNGCAW